MTREEISTFHTGDGFYELRFSEAEMSDAFNGGFLDAIDHALEIIDRARNNCRKGFTRHDEKLYLSAIEGFAAAVRQDILALKGTRDCETCRHSKDGKCAGTEECHECMWESKYIEADKE